MAHEISVSEEYIDTVCDWLEKWSRHKDSWIIPQFLKAHGIGWSYFQGMMEAHAQLHHIFEITISGLCEKWLLYAMGKESLPRHMEKILMKYLRVYDNHAYYVDKEAKKEINQPIKFDLIGDYETDDYPQKLPEGLHQSLSDKNSRKYK